MVKDYLQIRQWDMLIIAGIAIGIIGFLSPWGEPDPIMCSRPFHIEVGTSIEAGWYTLGGLTAATVFQLFFMTRRKVCLIFAVLISAIASLLTLGNWILQPIEQGAIGTYTILYGAYVTLTGALIVSGMAFIYIAATARKQFGSGGSR